MANTEFFKQVKKDSYSIGWKDIFSESVKPHSKEELSRKLMTDMQGANVSEKNMLSTWQKPWLWSRALMAGIGLYAFMYICDICLGGSDVFSFIDVLNPIITAFIVPVVCLIFFWETNVAQNISLYKMFVFFVVGGLFSLTCNTIIRALFARYLPEAYASVILVTESRYKFAPLSEEPAKLLAVLLLMALFPKNKRMYGLTGLAIGAAVGCGFSAFESMDYGMDYGNEVALLRLVLAPGGHIIWAASYGAAIGLHCEKGRFSLGAMLDKDFFITFVLAVGLHFAWNSVDYAFMNFVIFGLGWLALIYIVRRCLRQIAYIGTRSAAKGSSSHGRQRQVEVDAYTGSGVGSDTDQITIVCIEGPLKGERVTVSSPKSIKMGRNPVNDFVFPKNEGGISRDHCVIYRSSKGWVLKDNNSSYGTFVNGGNKIPPGSEVVIFSGTVFSLGSERNKFKVL